MIWENVQYTNIIKFHAWKWFMGKNREWNTWRLRFDYLKIGVKIGLHGREVDWKTRELELWHAKFVGYEVN